MAHKPLTEDELTKMEVWWDGRDAKNGPYDDDLPRCIAEIRRQRAEVESAKLAHQLTLDEFRDHCRGIKPCGGEAVAKVVVEEYDFEEDRTPGV